MLTGVMRGGNILGQATYLELFNVVVVVLGYNEA